MKGWKIFQKFWKKKEVIRMSKFDLDKVDDYIESLYKEKGVDRDKYIDETEFKDFIPVVDQDVSRMMQVLIKLLKPKHILEIGTSIGYSTVSFAKVVKEYGGKVTTIELDEKVAQQAIKNFEKEGVSQFIEVKIGDACKIIPQLNDKFDVIFQDVGGKELYPVLFNDCIRLLKTGGLLLSEDTLLQFKSTLKNTSYIEPLNEFNRMIVESEYLESTIIPIGDGLTVAVKI